MYVENTLDIQISSNVIMQLLLISEHTETDESVTSVEIADWSFPHICCVLKTVKLK